MNIIESIKNDKDLHLALITDTIEDLKTQNKFIKKILVFQWVTILLLILGIAGLSVYHNEKLMNFLNESSICSEIYIDTDDNSTNNGNISVKG